MTTKETARSPGRGTGPEDERRASGYVTPTIPPESVSVADVPPAVFRVIYTLGFASGREVERIAQEQHVPYYVDEPAFAEHIHRIAGMPDHDELEARRHPGYSRDELRRLREWCPA